MAMLNNQRGYLPIFVAKIKVPNHPSHFDHGRKKSPWLVRGHIFPAKNLHISVGDFQLAASPYSNHSPKQKFLYPLVNVHINDGKDPPFSMGKSTINGHVQ